VIFHYRSSGLGNKAIGRLKHGVALLKHGRHGIRANRSRRFIRRGQDSGVTVMS